MAPLYFEKKLEIHYDGSIDLLRLDAPFWRSLVRESGLNILHAASTADVRSYLLAESSLLVWKHRLLLLTCGSGRLDAALNCLNAEASRECVVGMRYSFPESATDPDFGFLERQFANGTWEKQSPQSKPSILEYSWSSVPRWLTDFSKNLIVSDFSERTFPKASLAALRDSEIVQEHDFSNGGYSCNICHGEDYLTVHFSPNPGGPYFSADWRGFPGQIPPILEAWQHQLGYASFPCCSALKA